MAFDYRSYQIKSLMETALDDDEEYAYEGEMSTYARTCAGDAISELRTLMERTPFSAGEIDDCVGALSDPRRIAEGRSARVLSWLGETSLPLFLGLAASSDPRLRLFAIETAGLVRYGASYFKCLCRIIAVAPQLLEDPDEEVRLAAASSSDWMRCNIEFIKNNYETKRDQPVIRIFYKFIDLLDDPSPKVRAAAARALGQWAAETARGALEKRRGREEDDDVREALRTAIEASTVT